MSLLASTQAVIDALSSGKHRAREITAATGLSYATVMWRLFDLRNMGAVYAHRMRSVGKHGRPEKHYRLHTPERSPLATD